MKRLVWLLVPALAFALGASSGLLRSFPYLSAQQNAPVTRTSFEWFAAHSALRGTAKSLANHFPVANMEARPGRRGIFVTCGTGSDDEIRHATEEEKHKALSLALAEAVGEAQRRFRVPRSRIVLMLSTPVGIAGSVYGKERLLDSAADGAAQGDFATALQNAVQ